MRRTRPDQSKCGSKEPAIMGKENERVDAGMCGRWDSGTGPASSTA
jgi:hypothetical protein